MKSLKKAEQNKKVLSFLGSKKFLFCILLICLCSTSLWGQETIAQLDKWSDKILTLFQSTWVKVILLVALIVEAIGVIVAGQQGGGSQILKKFGPWIIGTIILLCASGICSYFLDGLEFKAP